MIALLAQVFRFRRRDTELLPSVMAIVVVVVVVAVVAMTILSAVSRVLRRVLPENRRMEPGQVWLNLIPIFNIIWATVTVERVAESLRNEFTARDMHGPDERYGRRTGLIGLTLIASIAPLYPIFFITVPLAIGYLFAYWRHLKRYAARLKPGAYAAPPTEEAW